MRLLLALFFFGLLSLHTTADDVDLFKNLYAAISDIVAPGPKPDARGPVFLMELPGLAVAREDLDSQYWANTGFENRIPDAVFADFVDRAPRYTDTTFQDSGAKISQIWKLFMNSYKVPPNDDPNQLAAVEKALNRLENSTIEEDFISALDIFERDRTAANVFRDNCLAVNARSPSICAFQQVVPELRASVSWFNMETRRRTLLGAQATVLTLQSADLKSVFAEAAQTFSRSLRIDVGAQGFGAEYYLTFAQPRRWWTWFPSSSYAYDMNAVAGNPAYVPQVVGIMDMTNGCKAAGVTCSPTPTANWVITTQPVNGFADKITAASAQCLSANCLFYRANSGFTGGDSITINTDTTVGTLLVITVGVADAVTAAANAAFISVSAQKDKQVASSSTDYSSINVAFSYKVSNWWWYSAGGDSSFSDTRQSYSSSSDSTTSSLKFSLARVNIVRPWLNPLLLQMKPVGMYGVEVGTWSMGTGLPTSADPVNGRADFQLPLIPTAFIVARDIKLALGSSSSLRTYATSTQNANSQSSAAWGPFWTGKAAISTSKTSQRSFQSSVIENNELVIPGPQVIGWVCSPIPKFPNARWDDPVFTYRPVLE